ncbi:MAG: diguanylate cyclase, partial [Bacillota bacterium]|nr:diguanylate cyclase [Bacillota bacterium]
LHHHERWDGKGYPDGLSKETIPFLSRFIAVIDSYDAMVSERPYKKALSSEEAIAELLKNAGTQFDPAIVNEFVQMVASDKLDLNADIFNAIESPSDEEERPNSARYKNSKQMENKEVHNVPYVKYTLDKDFRIIKWDESITELTGYTEVDLKEKFVYQSDLIPERCRTLYLAMVAEQIGRHQLAYFEHPLLRKDGSEISVVCLGRSYFDSAVGQERSDIYVFDITQTNAANRLYHTEKQMAESRLEVWEQTFRKDSLTGLFNHSAFVSEVELKLLDKKYRTVFLMIDVDNFKDYNDTYGHRNGDEFLIVLADAIQESLRDSDISGRLGGDEFAAAMFFPAGVNDEVIFTRVRETFESIRVKMESVENGTTFSMGVSISEGGINTFKDLYDAADQAMYDSKNAGRNRLSIYENR